MDALKLMNIKASIYQHLPSPFRRAADIRFLPSFISWRLHPSGYVHTRDVLKPLQNKFTGYRCVIIGNGPSLKQMDLSVLKDEFTFGLNRIYMMFEEWGFPTTFLVVINRTVLNQFAPEISNIDALKFLTWSHREKYTQAENTVFLPVSPWKKIDGKILRGSSTRLGLVTNQALELAFFLGFSEVILIGVDHSYVEKGLPGLTVVSKGPDQNHFHPDYFGKGVIWQLPDYVAAEYAYDKIKNLFEEHGRHVLDATKGGKLQIFPKVDFEYTLKNSEFKNRSLFFPGPSSVV
jgi:hypothetical protein